HQCNEAGYRAPFTGTKASDWSATSEARLHPLDVVVEQPRPNTVSGRIGSASGTTSDSEAATASRSLKRKGWLGWIHVNVGLSQSRYARPRGRTRSTTITRAASSR